MRYLRFVVHCSASQSSPPLQLLRGATAIGTPQTLRPDADEFAGHANATFISIRVLGNWAGGRGEPYDVAVLIALGVALAALALATVGVLAMGALGLEPAWLANWSHAFGEARHRAAGVLAEFRDWLRLGR